MQGLVKNTSLVYGLYVVHVTTEKKQIMYVIIILYNLQKCAIVLNWMHVHERILFKMLNLNYFILIFIFLFLK